MEDGQNDHPILNIVCTVIVVSLIGGGVLTAAKILVLSAFCMLTGQQFNPKVWQRYAWSAATCGGGFLFGFGGLIAWIAEHTTQDTPKKNDNYFATSRAAQG